MMLPNLAVLGLAGLYLGQATAQSTDLPACTDSSILIDSLESLEAIQSCEVINGTITLEAGPTMPTGLELNNLREIDGNFLCINTDEDILIETIIAPRLTRITGDLYLSRLVKLQSIQMDNLEVLTRVRLNNLPSLISADFLSSLRQIDWNYEVWNTSLTEIKNDRLPYAIFVEIFDNPRLEKVSLTALKNASYNVALRRNRPGLEVDLRSLEETWYLELHGIESLRIPNLKAAIGHFTVNASSIEEIDAPELETIGTWEDFDVGGTISYNHGLRIENNPNLRSLSFPDLESVQMNLTIRNNSALREVKFPELERVTQDVRIEGEFDDVELPDLDSVGGYLHIGSTTDDVDCEPFDKLKADGKIRGAYFCPGGKRSGSEDDTKTSNPPPNAAVRGFGMVSMSLVTGLAGVVAGLLAL